MRRVRFMPTAKDLLATSQYSYFKVMAAASLLGAK